MNDNTTASKKDFYKAGAYASLLVALSVPLSFLGMQMLNFILGNVQV
ncbi:MAG: hypothetical protein WCG16_01775 [Methylococcales bacterium]